jgi:alpha-galactosidase
MVIDFLDDMGCDFYRQDYNFDPAESWALQDSRLDSDGNRVGITEIQYVTGHYAFLDAILATGRQIDNCASGGRMIDIEMTKRAIPLWRTDYTVSSADAVTSAAGIYSQGAGLSWWVVHHGGMGSNDGVDNEYGFRATMASGVTLSVLYDKAFAKRMIDELLHNREYMLHDFYILSQGYGVATETTNAGYEYYIPDEGRGYLVCFRPHASEEESTTFFLRGLDPNATYVIRVADTEETHEMTGQVMMEKGLKIEFPRTKVAHMIYFDKK